MVKARRAFPARPIPTAWAGSALLRRERRPHTVEAPGVVGSDRQYRPGPIERRRQRCDEVGSSHVAACQSVEDRRKCPSFARPLKREDKQENVPAFTLGESSEGSPFH